MKKRGKRVDFKLSKNWGKYPKGHVFTNLNRARARNLQDVQKIGKIVEQKNGESKTKDEPEPEPETTTKTGKATEPEEDKVEPATKELETK